MSGEAHGQKDEFPNGLIVVLGPFREVVADDFRSSIEGAPVLAPETIDSLHLSDSFLPYCQVLYTHRIPDHDRVGSTELRTWGEQFLGNFPELTPAAKMTFAPTADAKGAILGLQWPHGIDGEQLVGYVNALERCYDAITNVSPIVTTGAAQSTSRENTMGNRTRIAPFDSLRGTNLVSLSDKQLDILELRVLAAVSNLQTGSTINVRELMAEVLGSTNLVVSQSDFDALSNSLGASLQRFMDSSVEVGRPSKQEGMCDICGTTGMGTLLTASQVREAVFTCKFDPFALGLLSSGLLLALGKSAAQAYQDWLPMVRQNETDWHLCPRCFAAIQPYLKKGAASGAAPGSKKGCFIATAAYGSPDAPVVRALRDFRDTRLAPHRLGRLLVGTYARLSPPLARWIEPRPVLRWLVRAFLIRPITRMIGIRYRLRSKSTGGRPH